MRPFSRHLPGAALALALASLPLLSACTPPPWISLPGCQATMRPGQEQTWAPIIEGEDPEPTRVLDARSANPDIVEIVRVQERSITIRALASGEARVAVDAYISYEERGFQRSIFTLTVTEDEDEIPKVNNTCFHDDTYTFSQERPASKAEPHEDTSS